MAKKEQNESSLPPPSPSETTDWACLDALVFTRGLNGYYVQIKDETFGKEEAEDAVERYSVSVKVFSPNNGADVVVKHIATEIGLSQDIRTLPTRLDNIAKAALELAFATRPLAQGETNEQK